MPRRRHILSIALVAAALAAPQAAAAARLPANYVPSPGYDGIASAPRAALTGGTVPFTGVVRGTSAGGVAPESGTRKRPPAKPRRRHRTKTRPGPGVKDVPRSYLRIYRAAARRYGVDWRVLAAIGKMESDHGRSMAPGVHSGLNFADCCSGPMQICTVASCGKVWQAYAIDADLDGEASVYDPPDAIAAAAQLVRDLQAVFGRSHPGLMLAAYNAGPAAVKRHNRVPAYPETQAYVSQGLRYMKSLRATKKR